MKTEHIGFSGINQGYVTVETVRGGDEGETGHTRSGFNVCTHEAAAEQGEQQAG